MYITFYLLLGLNLEGANVQDCQEYMVHIRTGKQVTRTLVYHSFLECIAITGTCEHNQIRCQICNREGKNSCFDPQGVKFQKVIKIWAYSNNKQQGYLLGTNQTTSRFKKVQICFDVCRAIEKEVGTKCGSLNWRQGYMVERKYVFTWLH